MKARHHQHPSEVRDLDPAQGVKLKQLVVTLLPQFVSPHAAGFYAVVYDELLENSWISGRTPNDLIWLEDGKLRYRGQIVGSVS